MNTLLYTVSWCINGIRHVQSFHSYSESSKFVLELLENNNNIEMMMCKIYSINIDETDNSDG